MFYYFFSFTFSLIVEKNIEKYLVIFVAKREKSYSLKPVRKMAYENTHSGRIWHRVLKEKPSN